MEEHKTYCNECAFLEERPVIAEIPMDSGHYEKTGTRYYCPIHQKWFSLNTPFELMQFNYCFCGKQKGK